MATCERADRNRPIRQSVTRFCSLRPITCQGFQSATSLFCSISIDDGQTTFIVLLMLYKYLLHNKYRTMPTKKVKKRVPSVHRRRKTSKESFTRYIYKLLKLLHPDMEVSHRAMSILNSFVNDMFYRVTIKSSALAHYSKKVTLTSCETHTAIRLLLPGQLAQHAVFEGTKAVRKYTSSG